MSAALQIAHVLVALPVMAEALNKLERSDPLAADLVGKKRVEALLEVSAWGSLAMSAGGAIATPIMLALGVSPGSYPFLRVEPSTVVEVLAMAGIALLIVYTRVKKG